MPDQVGGKGLSDGLAADTSFIFGSIAQLFLRVVYE